MNKTDSSTTQTQLRTASCREWMIRRENGRNGYSVGTKSTLRFKLAQPTLNEITQSSQTLII